MIHDAVRAKLLDTPAVAAIVGERVYWQALPQNAVYPAITFERTSTRNVSSLTGPSGLRRYGFRIDCYDYGDVALTLSLAVRDIQSDAVNFRWVWVDDEADDFDAPTSGAEKGPRRVRTDLVVWVQE